ncbi:PfkB family carbohydrate kinase [Amycolatopsis sp. H20-H5]|uniref:PfkB family carbohydrate kinase n=1 Tax=Amycolatopsis sp. H20-H5 TaxID=3046309 RepID=UPI002DB5987B|nr:PfkB family carbohydrate kinase [Amycolatopsis sp. H20-H5]MEC3980135.1 PfkB family carbohydrate kinase [Amycolatopsis sp. H20-H5]
MTGRLVHTGQAVLDLVMTVPALPPAGGDVLATSTNLLPGGGFNVMSAAARSGADVLYAGVHGIGGFGDTVRAALAAEGVAVAHEPSGGMDTGVVVALVDASGERTFVTGAGAEGQLREDQLDAVEATAGDLVYVTGYSLLHESNRAALLSWLPRLPGSPVLFDPGPLASEIDLETFRVVMSTVDILSCNAREATEITRTRTTNSAIRALATMLPAAATVVIRDGPAGCLLHREHSTVTIPGFPVVAVDTNGAGDTHCGVLAAELLRGADVEHAALRANAAAALSVTRHGPATAPGREEIDELVKALT